MPQTHTHKSNLDISTQTLSRTHIYPQGSKEVLHLCMCVRMCKKPTYPKRKDVRTGCQPRNVCKTGSSKKGRNKKIFLHFSPTPSSVAAKLSFHFFPPLTSSRPLNRHVRIYLKDINAKIKDEVLHFKMYVYSSLLTYMAQWQLGGNRVDQTDNHTQAL